MDKILKGILKYRKTYRTEMLEQFKQVADRPEVYTFVLLVYFLTNTLKVYSLSQKQCFLHVWTAECFQLDLHKQMLVTCS